MKSARQGAGGGGVGRKPTCRCQWRPRPARAARQQGKRGGGLYVPWAVTAAAVDAALEKGEAGPGTPGAGGSQHVGAGLPEPGSLGKPVQLACVRTLFHTHCCTHAPAHTPYTHAPVYTPCTHPCTHTLHIHPCTRP